MLFCVITACGLIGTYQFRMYLLSPSSELKNDIVVFTAVTVSSLTSDAEIVEAHKWIQT